MESVVAILMICLCFSFLLKQSFNKMLVVVAFAAAAALFVGFMWEYAIEQSKTQISDWLHNPELMLDTSVILTIEVVLNMSYCILAAYIGTTQKRFKRSVIWGYRLLRWFPGFMIFPVLFSALVYFIFTFPGYSFSLISWSFGAVTLLSIVLIVYAIKWLLYEKELRLEFLFLTNILIAVLGIIATVNGRTAMSGESVIDIGALVGVIIIVSLFALVGAYVRRVSIKRIKRKLLK